jgi:hypothetical protein
MEIASNFKQIDQDEIIESGWSMLRFAPCEKIAPTWRPDYGSNWFS